VCLQWAAWHPRLPSRRRPIRPARLSAKPDPEALLIDIYKDLGANRLREAQAKADALVAAYPTFRLGHLVRGDLLLMHARPVRNFGAMADGPRQTQGTAR
jgi:predicted Zn-dependent protease